jgi:ribosomal protein S18 acetylase RimI-like enzyme
MNIRPMRSEDYDDLIALWREAGLPYRARGRDARERIARELAGPCAIFLVAEEEGVMAGAVLGTHDGRKGWINRVAVRPAYRRRGIARELVDAVAERLEAQGIEILTCLVEDWNADSLAFFEQLGFIRHPDIHYFSRRKHADV